jgi:DNA-binding PadR family transcriptional regulator
MQIILMLSKELVAASSTTLVLSILNEGENYGYALIQRVTELSAGEVQWSEGMLYPVLHWMEKEDLIESEWRQAESGHRRKYYRLRQKGRKALRTEKEQWTVVHNLFTKLWKTQPRLT